MVNHFYRTVSTQFGLAFPPVKVCLVQHENPCPQGKVRVQRLCHLNDLLPVIRCQVSEGYLLSAETQGEQLKFGNRCLLSFLNRY